MIGPVIEAPEHHMEGLNRVVTTVRNALRDSDRKGVYRGNPNPMAGHCYVAAECVMFLLGGRKAGWMAMNVPHEGSSHWFLVHRASGIRVDPTADQFQTLPPYENAVGRGFLTSQPCYRSLAVLGRIERGE